MSNYDITSIRPLGGPAGTKIILLASKQGVEHGSSLQLLSYHLKSIRTGDSRPLNSGCQIIDNEALMRFVITLPHSFMWGIVAGEKYQIIINLGKTFQGKNEILVFKTSTNTHFTLTTGRLILS